MAKVGDSIYFIISIHLIQNSNLNLIPFSTSLQTHIHSVMKVGHHGINLIPIDPLHIPSMSIKQGADSPVNIELKFTDVDLNGLSNFKFTKIR